MFPHNGSSEINPPTLEAMAGQASPRPRYDKLYLGACTHPIKDTGSSPTDS